MKKNFLFIISLFLQYQSYGTTDIKLLDGLFNKNISTIQANFTQTQIGVKKNVITTGSMKIKRPNKFIWNYNDGQKIICDGKTIFIYDEELRQVETKKYSKTLEKTPALLLSGVTNISDEYNITQLSKPSKEVLEWIKLTPKNNRDSNQIKSIEIGFVNSKLSKMNFVDNLDHHIEMVFSNIQENTSIADKEFKFEIPKSVDTIDSDS